jgi:hypothetical protein
MFFFLASTAAGVAIRGILETSACGPGTAGPFAVLLVTARCRSLRRAFLDSRLLTG